MSDVNAEGADGTESNGSAETKGADEGQGDRDRRGAPEKKTARRKPVWVCIPTDWEEIADVDEETGDLISRREPTKYSITRCEPKKKAVLALLALNNIDITNIGTVIMFRADPLDFGVSNQLDIRW
jgi:hypothetical protein